MAEREMDDPISKVQWALRGSQVAFAFFCMALIATMVSFDNTYLSSNVLPNIEIFIAVVSMPFAAAIVVIPYVYQKNGKLKALAVALRHLRFELVLSAIWAFLWTVVSLANSIYLGLRNCDPFDPQFNTTKNQHGEAFTGRLESKCNVGRGGLVFGWLAVLAWIGSVAMVSKEWYDNRRPIKNQPQFTRPSEVAQMLSVTSHETGLPAGTSLEEYKQNESSNQKQPQSPPFTSYSPPQTYTAADYPPAPLPPPVPQYPSSQIQIPEPQPPTVSGGGMPFPEPHRHQ